MRLILRLETYALLIRYMICKENICEEAQMREFRTTIFAFKYADEWDSSHKQRAFGHLGELVIERLFQVRPGDLHVRDRLIVQGDLD